MHFSFEDLHEVINALTTALDAKSHYTCGHSERVAEYALLLARAMKLDRQQQQRIHIGAHLHDIGKIGIPDSVLDKPGKLTPAEVLLMKGHPAIGDKIISQVAIFQQFVTVVRSHHERFDGSGYPDGLAGAAIPLEARIVAVADSLDAMVSTRPYRRAYDLAAAVREIECCQKSQFDPEVVAALLTLYKNEQLLLPVS